MTEEVTDIPFVETPVEPWGFHLILDVAGCDQNAINNRDVIHAYVKELVPAIDMIAYGEPQIVRFGTGDKEGYTLVQLIETSNICAHFCTESATGYLDVFSCKPFDPNVVFELTEKYFKFKTQKHALLTRRA
jgi:S-adenosylmethionine/arginine decarboxylase-like enzyme